MRARLAVSALLLIAASASAESADLRIELNVDAVQQAETTFFGNVSIRNGGPDTARNVVVTTTVDDWPELVPPCPQGRCAIGDVKPTDLFPPMPRIQQVLPGRDFTFTITVTVSSDTPDPNPANNSVTRTVRVRTGPTLQLFTVVPYLIDPARPFDVSVTVINSAPGRSNGAHDVVLTFDLPDGVEVAEKPAACAVAARRVRCTQPSLVRTDFPNPSVEFKLLLVAPPRYEGGELLFHFAAAAREESFRPESSQYTLRVVLYRTFFVTTTADDGLGSLRTAAVDAAALCKDANPCKIAFNIAEPGARPWKTIRLRSPLPPLTVWDLVIDGATQTTYAGTRNPDGPPIEISGGGTVAGDGLALIGSGTIANLAINGFGGNGISLSGSGPFSVDRNFIGTDPTGTVALPNFRGIGVAAGPPGYSFSHITNNVISGNVRSGIFVISGDMEVTGNVIGLTAHGAAPLPNGGSGIYFDRRVERAEVKDNSIAFNGEFGIGSHPQSGLLWLSGNRIWRNGAQAIDIGLDGPTPAIGNATLSTPVILGATFDPVSRQTTVHVATAFDTVLELFAGDAPGDAQRMLPKGQTKLLPPSNNYEITINENLRGKWITATASRWYAHPAADLYPLVRTTELSAPVQVQ